MLILRVETGCMLYIIECGSKFTLTLLLLNVDERCPKRLMELTMEDSDICQDSDVPETGDVGGLCSKRPRLHTSPERFPSPSGSEDELNSSSSDTSGGPLFPSDMESANESSSFSATYPLEIDTSNFLPGVQIPILKRVTKIAIVWPAFWYPGAVPKTACYT